MSNTPSTTTSININSPYEGIFPPEIETNNHEGVEVNHTETLANDNISNFVSGVNASRYAPKPQIASFIKATQESLQKKSMELAMLGVTNGIVYEQLKREIEELVAHIQLLQSTLDVQTPTRREVTVPFKEIPAFQLHGQTRILLDVHRLNFEDHREDCLSWSMNGDELDVWFNDNIKGKGMNWSEAKKTLINKFDTKDRRILSALSVCNITMEERETVIDFGLRFQSTYRDAGWEDNEFMAILCLKALPKALQYNVLVAYQARPNGKNDLPATADEVLHLANKMSSQKRAFSGMEQPQERTSKKAKTKVNKKAYFCDIHKYNASHTTEHCKARQNLTLEDTVAMKCWKKGIKPT
ncbi:uncharacterized protein BX664DRAFT_315983 [Halteromyces radiatus]|uniref:uncharacterized protein n=1 Tax=Halteromyces radiatus TaxID=101107 RepID=UPI00221EBD76|nr:uncharacterized protein BX664DRAFT_315970 [Halteromyces radiatus]XP_051399472.1 uncharacterized protein BX664DRAFT_315983 [Halteromyces radiatus]KAI8086801.1 hypothetical protein BX664DRAFT_315970 [Halteromyces radiatus]KAI8086812.1 hypothetical protein BX664DRAFT_315983 [Halteromyces radiatus]